jgi:hypothetical protein
MELVNLSAEPVGRLYSWIPQGLHAEKIVFLPDACPGKSPLPTGTAVLTRQADWRRFAVSDCGCGMRLLRSRISRAELTQQKWDELANRLRKNKGALGDLGGGNHFLDALLDPADSSIYFLVHTGSRDESGHVDELVDQPERFDSEFERVVNWAESNRAKIQEEIEHVFGECETVLDAPHNTYEVLPEGGAIIRKGSVKVAPGELLVIPSHMSGDVVVGRAGRRIEELLNSMSHGTGRAMSRSECKPFADDFDFAELRQKVLIPQGVDDSSLRTDGPYAYRDLDECLLLIEDYFEVDQRLTVIGYMGHL